MYTLVTITSKQSTPQSNYGREAKGEKTPVSRRKEKHIPALERTDSCHVVRDIAQIRVNHLIGDNTSFLSTYIGVGSPGQSASRFLNQHEAHTALVCSIRDCLFPRHQSP
uniref:Uncharacterized protein n=1 Tax=Steinernema glaseri TaxID=37863 RepID=A0A1I8A9R3_9BILA